MDGCSDGTLISTGQKFFSCLPGRGIYYPVNNLQPDVGSREYCKLMYKSAHSTSYIIFYVHHRHNYDILSSPYFSCTDTCSYVQG